MGNVFVSTDFMALILGSDKVSSLYLSFFAALSLKEAESVFLRLGGSTWVFN